MQTIQIRKQKHNWINSVHEIKSTNSNTLLIDLTILVIRNYCHTILELTLLIRKMIKRNAFVIFCIFDLVNSISIFFTAMYSQILGIYVGFLLSKIFFFSFLFTKIFYWSSIKNINSNIFRQWTVKINVKELIVYIT